MALTEKQIRNKILDIVLSIATDAKRVKRNPFTQDRSKWSGLFRHKVTVDDIEKQIAHAWIVRRSEYDGNPKSKFEKMTFEVMGFHEFNFGTDEANSEDKFQGLIDGLVEAFKDDDNWEFSGEEDEVTTDAIKFKPIGLIPTGNEFLHFAGGTLTVNVQRC